MNLEVITTKDGSSTIENKDLDESYHSKNGAINESKHIFIKNGLLSCNKNPINTLEIGFGTGLNALLTQINCDKRKIKNTYHTIDNNPIQSDKYNALNFCKELKIDNTNFLKMHNGAWDKELTISDNFTLLKIHNDLQSFNNKINYDIIYFDAFSPEKQPELWEENIFKNLFNSLNTQGILITYCAKGEIKRRLKKVGFKINSLPGPIGKREITQAKKI
jgi:tRNA U34 5-methylaminomethyl-2-thiouridine-forming methyltransferase MnmC